MIILFNIIVMHNCQYIFHFAGYFIQYTFEESWYSIILTSIFVFIVFSRRLEYFPHFFDLPIKMTSKISRFQKSCLVSWNDSSLELKINSIVDDNLAFAERKIGIPCEENRFFPPPRDSTRWNTYSFLAIDYFRQIHRIFLVEISLTLSVKYF